jgi:ketosteroid isomerase-like protein
MTNANQVADELEIRALVARYADAVNRRSPDDWAATWAEDGVWDLSYRDPFVGIDDVLANWLVIMDGYPFAIQIVHNGHLHITGETAVGRWYLEEKLQSKDGKGRATVGVYHDEYKKVDGAWRFARRKYAIIYDSADKPAMPGNFSPTPEFWKVA